MNFVGIDLGDGADEIHRSVIGPVADTEVQPVVPPSDSVPLVAAEDNAHRPVGGIKVG